LSHALLQSAYRPLTERPAGATIVVLSGYAVPRDPHRPRPELGRDTLYRCLHAAELYHAGPPCPIVVSGGIVNPAADMPPLAHLMRDFLVKLGIPREEVIVEDRSTTTYENAVECARILADRGASDIVLVTDASHMARAQRCFQKVGLQVTPAPCQMQDAEFEWSLAAFLPDAEAADSTEDALHEFLGLAWYKLKGRIP
jgi:uncharacterized SAM-binding protein YcdF (DUF218 family)